MRREALALRSGVISDDQRSCLSAITIDAPGARRLSLADQLAIVRNRLFYIDDGNRRPIGTPE